MSGQSGGQRLRLSKLNDQLTCRLCGGYFIDATTIIECLHSFCRSCIVKYLENNKYCPICEVQVHKSRPLLNIRPDHTLQDIVYKLVPACYQNEMRCRREFYAKHPEACGQGMSPESRGEPTESHIYSPDESLSLSLEYFNPGTKDSNNTSSSKDISSKPLLRRYLRCPAAVTVFHLQKLIRAKYGLTDAHRVDVMYKEEPLCSSYTLMDVMYIYHWRRKVPLHLSYRIFESSPKRIKLSEDNVNYKTSLLHAGIDSVDEKGEDPDKKEWKEVQLKISETGVMSITDISNSQSKEPIRIEHLHDQPNCPEKEISCVEDTKNNSKENLNADGKVEPAPISENTSQTEDSNKVASLNDKTVTPQQVTVALKVVTNTSNHVNDQSNSSKVSATEKSPVSTKFTPTVQNDAAIVTENVSVGTRVSQRQQIQAASRESSRTPDEKTLSAKETEKEDKQLSRNNNNNNNNNNNTIGGDGKLDIRKQTTKGTASETKVMNAGSKIDALSAKLQFQPKVGQVNNTLSKKMPKDKKAPTQVTKRIESRTENIVKQSENKPVESATMKTRPNSSNMNNKTSPATTKSNLTKSGSNLTSDDTPASTSNTTRYVSTVVPTSTEMDFACKESAANKSPQNNPVQSTRHEKSPVITDRKTNSREQVSTESSKTSQSSTTKSQKSNLIHNEASKSAQTTSLSGSVDTRPKETSPTVSQSIPVSCSVSQAISSFAYTVQDLVNNAMLKGSLKNLATAQSTMSGCNIQEHPVCSVPQFTMQQAQMSMQQATSSLKNNYVTQNISPSCPTTRQQSKLNLEITTGVYTVPPCPDAIPISLMKPTIRKSEVITKGTNLNEICAKIGASGSKINDICAKIGENSKERNKTETRNKPEIPDLLKIARRNSPPSGNNESKHTNIPNVPVYTPSNSTITTENTSVYSNVKDSLRSTSLSTSSASVATSQASMQKGSNTKKQNQIVGYKTLRESPRGWNPTLSKNNYIAVKNQTKEVQNQLQTPNLTDRNKPIQSKPAKIFKVRNVPRYLGNPASGVKPMYGIGNDTKEKDQSATISKSTSLNMMKIDPKTLSPIVSTSNSPIVSPPPYSPSARNYQNTPFSRDMCRSTGSPISPKNSPVNMLSTNPFIPSPTPNTNPRLIYSHFPPPFPDATRFPNPLIRSPIGIPPPSAFHSSLPPSINKLYQRSSYIPQTTGFPQVSQPPTVQRIPPSSYSSPKSPKTTSLTAISSPSFSIPKTDTQLPTTTSLENVAFLLSENVKPHDDINVFNLSKTGNINAPSPFLKNSPVDTTIDIQNPKTGPVAISAPSTSVNKQSATVCTSNVIGTSISTATTTTPVVMTSSTSTASVTMPLAVTSVNTSVAVSTSTFTSTSTAMTLAEASTQIDQMSKTKSQAEQCDSRLSGKNDVDKEGEKDQDKDGESEETKGSVNCKEDNCNTTSVPSSDKERNPELSEDVSQEKKDKTNSQVNGDVQIHTDSSNSTKEATATASQCNNDTADKSAAREQTNSHSTSQYQSDKLAVKQSEQQKQQPALSSKDTLKDATQVHNKSETQGKNAET